METIIIYVTDSTWLQCNILLSAGLLSEKLPRLQLLLNKQKAEKSQHYAELNPLLYEKKLEDHYL